MKFLLPLSVILACYFISCKKDTPAGLPPNSSCDIQHSRVSAIGTTITGSTDTVWLFYEYDNANRLTKIIDQANASTRFYSYPNDSINIYIQAGIVALCSFDSHGWLVHTRQYKDPDTTVITDFLYTYNSLGQLTFVYCYSTEKKDNYLVPTTKDSSRYVWQNGNLVREELLIKPWRVDSFNYVPNSDGRQLTNTPTQTSHWLYNPVSKNVLSANMIKLGDNMVFDNYGRLDHYTLNTNKIVCYRYTCIN